MSWGVETCVQPHTHRKWYRRARCVLPHTIFDDADEIHYASGAWFSTTPITAWNARGMQDAFNITFDPTCSAHAPSGANFLAVLYLTVLFSVFVVQDLHVDWKLHGDLRREKRKIDCVAPVSLRPAAGSGNRSPPRSRDAWCSGARVPRSKCDYAPDIVHRTLLRCWCHHCKTCWNSGRKPKAKICKSRCVSRHEGNGLTLWRTAAAIWAQIAAEMITQTLMGEGGGSRKRKRTKKWARDESRELWNVNTSNNENLSYNSVHGALPSQELRGHSLKKKTSKCCNSTKDLVTNKSWKFNVHQKWLRKHSLPSEKKCVGQFLPNKLTANDSSNRWRKQSCHSVFWKI